MNFRVTMSKQEAQAAVKLLKRHRNPHAPVLEHVYAEVSPLAPTLSITDGVTSVRVILSSDATTAGAGVRLVPLALLDKVATKARKGALITIEGASSLEGVTVSTGALRITSEPTVHVDDYPAMPFGQGLATVHRDTLARLLDSVIPAMSRDESRPVLASGLLEVGMHEVSLTGTDSYRLVHRTLANDSPGSVPPAIVHRSALETVAAALKIDATTYARVGATLEHVTIDIGRVTVTSRVVDGPFPDYRKLRPDNTEIAFSTDAAALATAALDIDSLGRGTDATRLVLWNGRLSLERPGADLGAATIEVGAVAGSPEPITVGLNAKLLAETVQAIGNGAVTVEIINGLRPLTFTHPDEEDSFGLLMPIKLT